MTDHTSAEPAVPSPAPRAPSRRGPLDAPERRRIIEEVVAELRPGFQANGGDCELVEVNASEVVVRLRGACSGCQFASATLQVLQGRLMTRLNQLVRVLVLPAGH
jgi:Fe-S cluster biogenesis protein NfuA